MDTIDDFAFDDLGDDPVPEESGFQPARRYDDVCIDPIFDMSVEAQERIALVFHDDVTFEFEEE